jgi:mannose-6-phosphate isomerase-like protein (cupin superfamily)
MPRAGARGDKYIRDLCGFAPRQRAPPPSAPIKEVFVVHEGQARFTIGTTSIDVASGQIVIVADGIPHKFVNSGEERLLQTDIHLNSEVETEWLEP